MTGTTKAFYKSWCLFLFYSMLSSKKLILFSLHEEFKRQMKNMDAAKEYPPALVNMCRALLELIEQIDVNYRSVLQKDWERWAHIGEQQVVLVGGSAIAKKVVKPVKMYL